MGPRHTRKDAGSHTARMEITRSHYSGRNHTVASQTRHPDQLVILRLALCAALVVSQWEPDCLLQRCPFPHHKKGRPFRGSSLGQRVNEGTSPKPCRTHKCATTVGLFRCTANYRERTNAARIPSEPNAATASSENLSAPNFERASRKQSVNPFKSPTRTLSTPSFAAAS